MNIFYRPKYQSDATQFINELKAKNPDMAEKQSQGRALLWDRVQDREAVRAYQAGKVSQNAYVYQTAPK
jgi:hypothetical protein